VNKLKLIKRQMYGRAKFESVAACGPLCGLSLCTESDTAGEIGEAGDRPELLSIMSCRSPRMLQPRPFGPVPDDTVRVAHAAFPDGHPYLALADALGACFHR